MFIQGSFVEGFPNALLESCAAGTPVIAFNVPGGTKEIVEHNINGYLVDDGDDVSFLNYLNSFKEWNPNVVRDSVYKKFNKEKIIKVGEVMHGARRAPCTIAYVWYVPHIFHLLDYWQHYS